MRKYNFLVFLFLLAAGSLSAQLVNNGGTITIQNNAKLVVQTDITNNTGTIINSGTIEVEGDFTNAATVTSNAASKVIFTGAANSDFDSGGSTFAIVENAKTASDVTLTSALLVNEQVDFSGTSNIVLGDHDLTLADAATSNGTAATGHFATTGLGNVVKMTDAAGTFTFDVGDGTNYTPLEAVHSGTYAAGTSSVSARVDDTDHPDLLGDADNYIARYWTVENNLTSPSIDMTGTYVAGDVTGTAADMVGARWENVDWEFGTGAQSGSTVSATTTEASSELTGMNFFGKTDLKIFLQGAYSSGSMTTNLTVPLTSPYTDAPKTVATIPANVVDWVKIETRDGSNNPETVTSAFLLSDGSVVGDDGVQLPVIKDASASSIIAIYHRNHLPIRTPATLDLTDPSEYDFSSGLAQAYENVALATDAMVDVGSGVFGLYRANVNSDTNLNIVDFILTKQNTTPTQSGVYSSYDVNMDGNTNILDFILAKQNSTPTKPAHL